MDDSRPSDTLITFLETGIYQLENSNAVFIDPVRVLNRSYTRHKISPSAYYTRSFEQPSLQNHEPANPKKRKRKAKKPVRLNEREQIADKRHQEVRHLLLKAHGEFLRARELLEVIKNLKADECKGKLNLSGVEHSFVELGKVWQAPLYEITLNFGTRESTTQDEGTPEILYSEQRVVPLFNHLVVNESSDDVEAEFLGTRYILPKQSSFYMSDLQQIHKVIPVDSSCGFNLIVVDPPWENASARQKSRYPTLPNRYFLSLPIKQLSNSDGALVALWVTNREKLRNFVENELFPAWGVRYVATFYWLKVKPDGLLISDLDLFHHRPYECLILGYSHKKDTSIEDFSNIVSVPDNQIIISIPGDYSRKPPVGELLLKYAPAFKSACCIELFAREQLAGWTSWGNEPLHFQESRYFL